MALLLLITNRIAGIKFDEAYTRVEAKKIERIPVKIIHYNDLIINKLASARPRDLDDVENLSKIKREEEKLQLKPPSKKRKEDHKQSSSSHCFHLLPFDACLPLFTHYI